MLSNLMTYILLNEQVEGKIACFKPMVIDSELLEAYDAKENEGQDMMKEIDRIYLINFGYSHKDFIRFMQLKMKVLEELEKSSQPERLNPRGVNKDASNSLISDNKKNQRGRSEEVSPPEKSGHKSNSLKLAKSRSCFKRGRAKVRRISETD